MRWKRSDEEIPPADKYVIAWIRVSTDWQPFVGKINTNYSTSWPRFESQGISTDDLCYWRELPQTPKEIEEE